MSASKSFVCYVCHQPASVCYIEIDKNTRTQYFICSHCPYPTPYYSKSKETFCVGSDKEPISLVCGYCRMGWRLQEIPSMGCHLCYTNFRAQLITLLTQHHAVSPSFAVDKHQGVFHVGRQPGDSVVINPLMKLIALNEALQDTLAREDYEQAAMIRDQIKHLKDQQTHDTPAE